MIRAEKLKKQYVMGDSVVNALDGVDVGIDAGEFVAIVGASGSGKSTLMHIIGCLDRATSGTLEFQGELVSSMREKQLARIRNQHIGFVFQTFNLINRTTALENVVIPLVYTRASFSKTKAMAALDRVGLAKRARHTPGEMSGGECQRVAIARAVVNNPRLILADEPTGNLDSRTGEQIMRIFHELHATGITIVIVTHEMEVACQADRMIRMRDGLIVEDTAIDDAHREELLKSEKHAREEMFKKKHATQRKQSPSGFNTVERIPEKG